MTFTLSGTPSLDLVWLEVFALVSQGNTKCMSIKKPPLKIVLNYLEGIRTESKESYLV